jgi:hypothetical protein
LMAQDVKRCRKMSQDVPRCPKMSKDVSTRPHRFSQPRRRRHASTERRLVSAIGRGSSGRGSRQQHCCTARAQRYITLPKSPKESINYRSQQKKKPAEEEEEGRRHVKELIKTRISAFGQLL